jgi:sugar phosphate isomerase/epimerase
MTRAQKLPIGIQLYTVRDLLDKDFTGTLKALADIGYQGVEFAWKYGGMSPEKLADFLKRLGLRCCGLHTNLDDIRNPQSDSYQYAKALGSPYLTTSRASDVAKDWNATIRDVAAAAAVASREGYVFTYHNHAHEFAKVDGAYALDLLYERTNPAHVKAELDTYWIRKGGEDPAAYIRKYAGRVPQVHLKDMDSTDEAFAEIGEGCLDMKDILAATGEAGSEWLIVEQDACKRPPLESAKISIENLKRLGVA